MDLSDTIQPVSEQLDSVELLGGPRTFTIESVSKGNAEQPVNIHLVGFPRPWRPGKSMRRVLVACWGADTAVYIGRRVTLYCDPDVRFGGLAVGGTRIAALSHIDKPRSMPLLVTRGRSAIFTVKPLTEPAPATAPTAPAIDDETLQRVAALRASWKDADAERRKVIEADVERLMSGGLPDPAPGDGELFPGAS